MKVDNRIECWLVDDRSPDPPRVLLLQTARERASDKVWQPVVGGVAQGEDWSDACVRRVRDETGIDLRPGDLTELEFASESPLPQRGWVIGRTLFVARTAARDVRLSDDHADARWVSLPEAGEYLSFDEDRQALTKLVGLLSGE
jgi:ADP-ribose pyrophosphatase YjhB (NUDIX family)